MQCRLFLTSAPNKEHTKKIRPGLESIQVTESVTESNCFLYQVANTGLFGS